MTPEPKLYKPGILLRVRRFKYLRRNGETRVKMGHPFNPQVRIVKGWRSVEGNILYCAEGVDQWITKLLARDADVKDSRVFFAASDVM